MIHYSPQRSRLGSTGFILLAVLAAAVVWSIQDSEPPESAPPAQEVPRRPAAPKTISHVPWVTPVPPVAPESSRFVANTVKDVCGLARLSVLSVSGEHPVVDSDAAPTLDSLPTPVGRDALAAARERMLMALRSGDARARVTALLLIQPASDDAIHRAAWAQSLLEQASASQDSASLASAEPACSHLPDAPACRLGLIRARLRIEPDNARHWAALADEDPNARDEAWAGLTKAKHWHEHAPNLILTSQAAVPADIPGYLRLALGLEAHTRGGSSPTPGEGFVQEQCRADLPERRAQCEQLMQLMVERSDSPQTLVSAQKLVSTLGWSTAREQVLQRELQALLRSANESSDTDQPWSCAAVDAWQKHLVQVASVGELGALRARLQGLIPGTP